MQQRNGEIPFQESPAEMRATVRSNAFGNLMAARNYMYPGEVPQPVETRADSDPRLDARIRDLYSENVVNGTANMAAAAIADGGIRRSDLELAA